MSEQTSLTIDSAQLQPAEDLAKWRTRALGAGLVGLAATAFGYFHYSDAPSVFFRSYLVAWVYWLGIALGLLMLCMLTHVSGGRWGIMMHRVQTRSGLTLPLIGALGLPILFLGGMEALYPWSRPEVVASDALVQVKTGYLKLWMGFEGTNPEWMASLVPGFIPRYFLYFLLWTFWAWKLDTLGRKHDETGDESYKISAQRWSAGGLVLFILLLTFASIDWLMSTDPHWFSSLYGPQLLIWQGLSALCFSVPLLIFLGHRRPLDQIILKKHYHDYGKLMLALTMVWGYFSVSQWLIIWSGNLPEEVVWYLHRNTHGWKLYTIAVVVGAFFLPFLILLSQDIKFRPKTLLKVALLILFVRWFDYNWQVGPNVHPDGVDLVLFDIAPFLFIGGIWTWFFLGQLKDRALVPIHEREIKEALAHG
ncbi:MAG: hypothetical protein MI919_14690 [Holophagales bacterium]|nr:hypothetical protein [Holophagales bacterium]